MVVDLRGLSEQTCTISQRESVCCVLLTDAKSYGATGHSSGSGPVFPSLIWGVGDGGRKHSVVCIREKVQIRTRGKRVCLLKVVEHGLPELEDSLLRDRSP